ncbi:ankyrin repeat-containing domain protein [Globomyces pollinis-pini]|nr:ankyrin repeat-containing domain protein [Globomyces pollinis-pini]
MIGIGYFTWDELVEALKDSNGWWICDFISETSVDILVRIREHSGELNLNAFRDDEDGTTACENAIRKGNLAVVKYILASDDFDGLQSDRTIHMINHEFMMEYFFFECDIEYRASVHEENYKLMRVACKNGHSSFIRRVIEELKPNVFYNNIAPIHLAIQNGHLSIVQMIIEEAMKLGITDALFDPNQSLIEVACEFNQRSVLEYILTLGKIDINANDGFALVTSCLQGSADCLQLLLNDPQCDISNLPANICTKMMKVGGNAKCLKVLFNDGRFDWIDWKELLKQSCLFDKTPYVAYILENDIVDPNVDNQEAFQIAFTSGFYRIVTLFLNHPKFTITSIPNQ